MGAAARHFGLLALCAGVLLVLGGAASAAAPDNALQFNGSSQYVSFGPSAGTGAGGLGAPQFTLETWFKQTGVGARREHRERRSRRRASPS